MSSRLAALDTIAAILRVDKTPEHLAALDGNISAGKIDWPQVINLANANANLVSPTLWSELRSHGLERNVPGDVRNYFEEIHRLNTERNRRLREQAIEVIRVCNKIGVEPVLLKGVISLFAKTYRDSGARMMTDIDIMVPREKAEHCWSLLRTRGYSHRGNASDKHEHHLQPLSRPGEYAVVEIHHDVLPSAISGQLFGASLAAEDNQRITQVVNNGAEHVSHGDLLLRTPSPTARVLHCLLHSAFKESNAYRSGILPLRSIHELALLQSLFVTDIDWDTISQLLSAGGKPKLLRAWLYLAHRLFGSVLPNGWEPTPGAQAHYARCRWQARWGLSITLRHLTRV